MLGIFSKCVFCHVMIEVHSIIEPDGGVFTLYTTVDDIAKSVTEHNRTEHPNKHNKQGD